VRSETELEMVERHVRDGAAIVRRQAMRVGQLASAGRDTSMAETMLALFEGIQAEHIAHLARIQRQASGPRRS
jgi:hypothetical protein